MEERNIQGLHRREGTFQRFQKEMEIWQPKWEAYKKTASFKEFKCLKQALSASEMDGSYLV